MYVLSRNVLRQGVTSPIVALSRTTAFHSFATRPDIATFLRRQNNSASFTTSSYTSRQAQTLTEKIVQQYAVGIPDGKSVRSGDYISISPEKCMTHGSYINPQLNVD